MAVTGTTTSVIRFTASGDSITGSSFIRYLRWVGATTQGHTLSVEDGAGNELMYSEADGGNFLDVAAIGRYISSLTVATMASGRLYAYVGAPMRGTGLSRGDNNA